MLIGILIILTVLYALVIGALFYEDGPVEFVVGFVLGLLQGALVSAFVVVAVHFIVKFW